MAKYELPYFGKITLSEDDDYHEIEDVVINDCQVSINIDCMGETPTKAEVADIQKVLASLPEIDKQVHKTIVEEYHSNTASHVKDYVDLVEDIAEEQGEALLSLIKLTNVCILTDATVFAVLDYTIGEDLTDEILAVGLDREGKITSFSIES